MSTSTLPPKRNRAPVHDVLRAAETPLTVAEIAAAASCSTITVRRHLTKLIKQGQAANAGIRPRTNQNGRPRAGRGEFLYTA